MLTLLLLSLNTTAANAQNKKNSYLMNGTILNKETGKPVEFATIVIIEIKQKMVIKENGT